MSADGTHDQPGITGRMKVAETITCVDCLGTCYLGSYEPDEGWRPGDVVFYRCRDCLDRWDIVLEEDNDPGGDQVY